MGQRLSKHGRGCSLNSIRTSLGLLSISCYNNLFHLSCFLPQLPHFGLNRFQQHGGIICGVPLGHDAANGRIHFLHFMPTLARCKVWIERAIPTIPEINLFAPTLDAGFKVHCSIASNHINIYLTHLPLPAIARNFPQLSHLGISGFFILPLLEIVDSVSNPCTLGNPKQHHQRY